MSLKNFLAVGHSFTGGPSGKSPYELRKENLLPRFGQGRQNPSEREPEQVQADWLDETPRPQETVTANQASQTAPLPAIPASAVPAFKPPQAAIPERKGAWYYLSFGFLRRKKSQTPLVQSELGLDHVRVVRNDLEDSDLELVVVRKKRKKPAEPIFSTTVTNPNGQWNSLTARLFDLGQKRR